MISTHLRVVLAGAALLVGGCTGGQTGAIPTAQQADVSGGTTLQFAVGTARFADGKTYLNTLVTYRQANGLAGTLINTPTITAPAGFVVPNARSAGTDAGTNHISGTPPAQPGATPTPPATTFGQSGGAFAYGFAPANSTTSGAANYPQFTLFAGANNALYADDASTIIVGSGAGNVANVILADAGAEAGAFLNTYTQPLYVSAVNRLPFILGPPAEPEFHNGTFPAGFLGYPAGFTMFGAAPVAGSYQLSVAVPANAPGAVLLTKTASANLTNLTPLAAEPAVTTVASDGAGGATFTVAPPPAGVTHQLLLIVRVKGTNGSPTFYTIDASAGGTFALTTANGPINPAGQRTAPFAAGDSVFAYVAGTDYDALGLGPPNNVAMTPAIPAQADVTVSPVTEVVYTAAAGPLSTRRGGR